jgi:hypothetical protein
MDAAWVVAAIGVGGAMFMLWFLSALLREGALSFRNWAAPKRQGLQRELQIKHLQLLRIAYDGGVCLQAGSNGSYGAVELSENENHEKDEDSALITLDVRVVSGKRSWRTIHPKPIYVLRERRL